MFYSCYSNYLVLYCWISPWSLLETFSAVRPYGYDRSYGLVHLTLNQERLLGDRTVRTEVLDCFTWHNTRKDHYLIGNVQNLGWGDGIVVIYALCLPSLFFGSWRRVVRQLGYNYRGWVPRLRSDNCTCCHTPDRAGRPWLLSQPVTLYWHRPNR